MPAEPFWGSNSRQVQARRGAETYDDLLNPRWKNAIAIDSNKIEWVRHAAQTQGPLVHGKAGGAVAHIAGRQHAGFTTAKCGRVFRWQQESMNIPSKI